MRTVNTVYTYTVGETIMVDTEPFGKVWKQILAIHDETGLPIYRKVVKVETREEIYGNGIFALNREK